MTRAIILFVFTVLTTLSAHAQSTSTQRGADIFQANCASCHVQAEIEMRLRNDWTDQSAADLFASIKATMPAYSPGSLSDEQYVDVTAYVMQLGNAAVPDGNLSLAALGDITIRQRTRATDGLDYHPWTVFNGDLASSRFAPLDQINADNVADLEIAWRWAAGNFGPRPENLNVTSPIMANGRLYVTAGATRNVIALDAATGQTLWMYRTEEGERFDDAPRKNSGKGVSYWTDGEQEIIFFVTPGYMLVALDAETGKPLEQFGDKGIVDLHVGLRWPDPGIRDDRDITLTFPPLVVDDVIVVGAAHLVSFRPPHAENVIGDVRAYDVHSGEHLWTFKTIPERGEYGYDTWLENSADRAGNAGVWTAMSADPELGLVYLPVESGTGDRYGGDRPGDNLFTGSVVAVDYKTGEMAWYFQHLRHDIWDYDTPSAPVLADLPNGRKVLVQMTKQSFAYVLDRETGEPVWEMVDTPVPQTDVPGEWTADTQPFPSKPPAYDRQGISEDDLINFTPEVFEMAKEAVKPYRMGPLFQPPSLMDDADGTIGTLSLPGTLGGSNWEGSAVDPATGILYIPSRTDPAVLALVPGEEANSTVRWVQGPARGPSVDGLPIVQPPWGRITAIDLNSGEKLWHVANADTPDYVKNHPLLEGVDIPRTGIPTRAGLLLTETLLFAGEGQGGGPKFRAHDKATGEIIAEIDLPASQSGTPVTYVHEGKQYIVMAISGGGRPAEIIALALPD